MQLSDQCFKGNTIDVVMMTEEYYQITLNRTIGYITQCYVYYSATQGLCTQNALP